MISFSSLESPLVIARSREVVILELGSNLEKVRCDAFMDECDVWNIMVDIVTIVHRYFYIEGYVNYRGRW